MNLSFIIHTLVLFLPAIQGQFLLKDDESSNVDHNNNKYDKPPIQQLQPRIVGGNPTKPSDHSFMVSWHWYSDLFPACGGSLVASNLVLTAAHCQRISGPVRIGSHYARDRPTNPDNERIVTRTVINKIPHPQFSSREFHNDFLLLELDQPVDTRIYRPITLNYNAEEPSTGDWLTVLGYGRLKEGGSHSEVLQEATIPAVSDDVCQWQYRFVNIDPEIQLCAGFENGYRDSCQGDSGGPLLKNINGTPTQVGVVSAGAGCGQPNESGVYARTSGATTWLQTEICQRAAYPKPQWCYEIFPNAEFPTSAPTASLAPTTTPSVQPSEAPSLVSSYLPSGSPSQIPTTKPSVSQSLTPTLAPSSQNPSLIPTAFPSQMPSRTPSRIPSTASSTIPTTLTPTIPPSYRPTPFPTISPTTTTSSSKPTKVAPTPQPTKKRKGSPNNSLTLSPTRNHSQIPTMESSMNPTLIPTLTPSTQSPSINPTKSASQMTSFHRTQIPTEVTTTTIPTVHPTSHLSTPFPTSMPTTTMPTSQHTKVESTPQPTKKQKGGRNKASPTASQTKKPAKIGEVEEEEECTMCDDNSPLGNIIGKIIHTILFPAPPPEQIGAVPLSGEDEINDDSLLGNSIHTILFPAPPPEEIGLDEKGDHGMSFLDAIINGV